MANPDYVDGDPFVLKGEGLPVESINNFILLGGSLEGTVDIIVPTNFKNGEWSNQETPQKALFCKFTLQNMTGINNVSNLVFSNGQGCIIKSEIFLQLLEKVSKIEFQGTGLSNLQVNVLKNYPAVNPEDTIFEDIDINGAEIALLDSLMDNSSFYLQLIATADNIEVDNITLTIATKKLGGSADIQFDDENLRINRINLEGGNIFPLIASDLTALFTEFVIDNHSGMITLSNGFYIEWGSTVITTDSSGVGQVNQTFSHTLLYLPGFQLTLRPGVLAPDVNIYGDSQPDHVTIYVVNGNPNQQHNISWVIFGKRTV